MKTISERILNNLPWFDADQDELVFTEDDMLEGYKFGLSMSFESTDDYYEQIIEQENGLMATQEGTPTYSRKQFKQIIHDAFDVFASTKDKRLQLEIFKTLI